MITFSDYMSSLGLTFVILGFAIAVLPFFRRENPYVRAALFGVSVALGWRYMAWRLTDTTQPLDFTIQSLASWSFAGLEAMTILSMSFASFFMSRTIDRGPEADRHQDWWGDAPAPRVDIYIATYNEEQETLERTIAGAKHMHYDRARVFVLDDGRRRWLEDLCEDEGIGYIARPFNTHAKAGNLNYAFWKRMSDTDAPDFIAVLDADFVPHRHFVDRAISLFHDPRVALAQTPQYFFNPDPVQHNLGITSSYPDEQRFFFNHVEPARDAWGAAACCGTSAIIRAIALAEVGGLPTESVTEDFLLTLRLSAGGWKTVYLNEPLSEGLAPEGLKEYISQRARWCLGTMQIVRGEFNPFDFRHRLNFIQRVGLLDSVLFWATTFPFRLAAMVCPLLYWYFGVMVVNASVTGVIEHFAPFYAASLIAVNWVASGLNMPVVNDVSHLIAAWPISRAVFTGLFRKGPYKFSVTAKGGDRSRTVVQWRLMTPFAIVLALSAGGLCLSLLSDYSYAWSAGDGRVVVLFWTIFNMVVLAAAVALCVELPRSLHSMRAHAEPADLEFKGHVDAAWVLEMSSDGARVRGPGGHVRGERVGLVMEDIGRIEAEVAELRSDGYALKLFATGAQRTALFARLHTSGGRPGVVHGSLTGVIAGVARRLLAWSH